ncbi:MAG: glucosyltransferase domain-containing protein [Clostridia bacterium]|nr:glucosyltransferase domain-containing protein [Clostridia bacterium]
MHTLRFKNRESKLFFCISLAALLPYLLYGFRYFPVLDDYIQYWGYPARGDLSFVYLHIGTLATRPLASLLDPAFWGKFWPVMGLALILITAMHCFSAFLFYKTMKRFSLPLSPFFLLLYLLLPLGMEGRYWISAASRLVTGLFFASVSLWFLSRFLQEKNSAGNFILFALFQLISCGFYESVAIFSVTAAVLLFFFAYYQKRNKNFWFVPLVSVINIGLLFSYYKLFSGLGMQGSRASASLSLSALPGKGVAVIRQVAEAFSLLYESTIKGCFAGVSLLFSKGIWGVLLLLLTFVLCFFLSRLAKNETTVNPITCIGFEVAGIILFFAPLLPNMMAEEVWITNRSLFVSIIGIALILEPFWSLFHRKHIRQTLIFIVAFIFITANFNEYDVYKRTNALDAKLLDQIVSELEDDVICGEKNLVVYLPEEVVVKQNAFYKDHVKSVFDSDWALTGALRERLKTLTLKSATPVLPGQTVNLENAQIIILESVKE